MTNQQKFKFSPKIWGGLLLIVVLVIVYQFAKNQFTRNVVTSVVQKGDIRDSVSGNVRVLAEQSFQLRSETQSKLEFAALIPFGRPIPVDKNQTLFLMNTEDLERSLEQNRITQSFHKKRLKNGSTISLQLELEEKNLESFKTLSQENSNDISPFELESKINLVERLRRQYELEKISNEETTQSLNLEREQIEHELEKHKIRSPIQGTLVSSSVQAGDTIFAGQVLGEIQSDHRIIEVTLNEEDFAGINEGQKVGVTIFSFGNKIFEGVVKRLSANVDPITGRRKLFVKLTTSEALPVGSSGRAEIIKRKITGTTIMPRKALLGTSAFIVKDGTVLQKTVEIGAKNLEFVEITKGLKPKDMVISETPHLFYDGEKVSPTILE